MTLELKEFRDIVDADWGPGRMVPKPPTADELTTALQVLLVHQCIYASTTGIGRTYDVIRANQTFFEKYFGALGFDLVVSQRDQMIALRVPVPQSGQRRYDRRFARLRKDETLVLLALKLAYEEGIKAHEIGAGGIPGAVEISTNDIVDKLIAAAKTDAPDERRLLEILAGFRRKGIVQLGETDRVERVTPVTIMPGVEIVAPEGYVQQLAQWAVAADTEKHGTDTGEAPAIAEEDAPAAAQATDEQGP